MSMYASNSIKNINLRKIKAKLGSNSLGKEARAREINCLRTCYDLKTCPLLAHVCDRARHKLGQNARL